MSGPAAESVRQSPATSLTGADTDDLLVTRNLTKHFGGLTAVDGVDFAIQAGELRCLIGPNGAGKSTFLELVVGELTPSEGAVYFDGRELTDLDVHERVDAGLSVKYQSPHVYGGLTVAQNLSIPLQRTDRETDRVLHETADRIGLETELDTPAGDLSHGQQQRLEIGMATTLDPEVMLLDEPVAGMSVDETAEVADLVESLNADGMAFLVIEHDMDFVRRISDRVTVLDQGGILTEGPIEEVENDDAVRRIYLGEDA